MDQPVNATHGDNYTLPATAGGERLNLVNMTAYTKDVLRTEKPLATIHTDPEALKGILKIGIVAGALIDLCKKAVIYGKEMEVEEFIKSVDNIHAACDAFEAAVWRKVPDNYEGEDVPVNPRLLHAILGGFGENAELLEVLLNQIENRGVLKLFGKGGIVEEAGDDNWYDALRADAIAEVSGCGIGETMTINIAKLKARYPDKFTLEASENRDLAAEEKVLGGAQ